MSATPHRGEKSAKNEPVGLVPKLSARWVKREANAVSEAGAMFAVHGLERKKSSLGGRIDESGHGGGDRRDDMPGFQWRKARALKGEKQNAAQ